MNDTMDSWAIDGKKWDLPCNFHVSLTHDGGETRPDQEYDCYDAEDIAAWKRDEWCFVTVDVTPVDEFKTIYARAMESLGAVEWGDMPGVTITRKSLEDLIQPMAEESVTSVRSRLVPDSRDS